MLGRDRPLPPEIEEKWRSFRDHNSALSSPFFSPDFIQIVAAAQNAGELAILLDGSEDAAVTSSGMSAISAELLADGGAQRIDDEESFFQAANGWLGNPRLREEAGLAALSCVKKQQGVIELHLQLIQTLIHPAP